MTTTSQVAPLSEIPARRSVEIELLALDLTSCTRCVGTLANIEKAIDAVRQMLDVTGTSVGVRRVVIESEAEARQHRFVSSPTIRIAGREIVFDTLESACNSCTDLCGCAEGTSCRVWRYQGAEYTEAPVGLIVEALLREVAGVHPGVAGVSEAPDYEVPANLHGFFAGKASRAAAVSSSCCPPSDQANCCEPAEKASCCAGPEPATCGCR